jgi:hypothetical protein
MAALAFSLACEAQAAPPDDAKKHFDTGRKLRADGDCENAIPQFEMSLAAETSIGAYYNLGYCEAQLGHRQKAYVAYRHARDMASAKKDPRLQEISGLIATLMETPHIRLLLPQPLPPGFRLQVDGELVPETLYEEETVLFTKASPTHDVVASAPGYPNVTMTVETKQLRAVDFDKASGPKAVAPVAPPPEPARPPFYRRPAFGIGVGAVGVGALAAGLVLLAKYNLDLDEYEERANVALRACGDGVMITSEQCLRQQPSPKRTTFLDLANGYNRRDSQGRDAGPLMGAFIVGGVVLAGIGVYVIVTARSAEKKTSQSPTFTPIVGPGLGGGAMTLRF